MQRSDLRRRLTAAVLSHPRWRVGPTPKRLKLANGTRVDRRMIEQADDKIRERVDYYLGRMFGGEDVPETMRDLSYVTSQVRETFERLYEDVEDIVEDEELTQAESTELWKVVSKALTDHIYDVIYGTQDVLDSDDYDKLEKAVVKGFDDSDEGPLVDEDDEEERQEALNEYQGKKASDLRGRLVRLAHENPTLRPHLLPLLSKMASKPISKKPTFVKADDGLYYVQRPAANQWGFELVDDTQSWPGGFGVATSWEIVPLSKVPRKIREDFEWLIDEYLDGNKTASDLHSRPIRLVGPILKLKFGSEDADLRSRLIRLAHENVTLRSRLLPLLSKTAGTESALLEALLPKVRWYRLMGELDTHSAGRGDKLYEALQERVRLTSNEDRALGILRNLEAKRDVDSAYLVESARKAADLLGLPPNDTSMAKFDGPLAKLFQPNDWYGFVNTVVREGARLLNASLAHLESRVEVIFRSNEFRNAFWKLVKYSEGSPAPSAQEVFDTIMEAAIALDIPLSRLAASRQVSAAPKLVKFRDVLDPSGHDYV